MRSLLDVNVLIALFDQDHVFNERAHQWLETEEEEGIATCPLTENGLVRILSHPSYSKSVRLVPAVVIERLARFCMAQDHVFWADFVSLREPEVFRIAQSVGPRQVTAGEWAGLWFCKKRVFLETFCRLFRKYLWWVVSDERRVFFNAKREEGNVVALNVLAARPRCRRRAPRTPARPGEVFV